MNKTSSFDQLLGKIFFGAAHADNVVKQEEISRMNELLEEHWKDDMEKILESFYLCLNLNYDHSNLFEEIAAFKEIYPETFDKDTIEKVMKTSYKIVASFSSTNKSEVIFISQLRNSLEK